MRNLARLALIGIFAFGLSAARITLRDGTTIYGQFISGTPQDIVIQDENGMRHRFDVNQVQLIDFGAVNAPANRVPPDDRDRQNPDRNPPPPPPDNSYGRAERNYGNRFAVLSPGTQISVRTDESINSQNAAPDRTFTATISQDVIAEDGRLVIPRGSPATLVIRRVDDGSTFSNGSFVLDLDSVRVNGRNYLVSTTDLKQSDSNGIGANKRTGEMVGGGAVLGTLLGAIAGGGKGAAIGAIAGAAAGGGVQVLTKGHEIRVPAETQLNFKLDRPLELREAR
jgi:hypothetical protein